MGWSAMSSAPSVVCAPTSGQRGELAGWRTWWRAKEGCEGRVAEKEEAIPRLLESRERAFYVTLD
jgi:hypothetical protein